MGIVTRSCAVQLSTRCMYKPERRPLGPILATPPFKPNKPHFADPTGGYPPESALGTPQPYNSILDERRAFQPVKLRAALVTGVTLRRWGAVRQRSSLCPTTREDIKLLRFEFQRYHLFNVAIQAHRITLEFTSPSQCTQAPINSLMGTIRVVGATGLVTV